MIVAGFGARAHSSCAELRDALEAALLATALPLAAVKLLAAPADKLATLSAFAELGAALQLPVYGVDAQALSAQATLTESTFSRAARGCGSVAEAAALAGAQAAVGGRVQLCGVRQFSRLRSASCALATGVFPS